MRICIFTDTIDKSNGGPSRSVPMLARGLSEIGVDVTLMTVWSNDMNDHLLDGTKVNLDVLPSGFSYKELEERVISGNFDLIHMQGIWLPLYHRMSCIARKHSIKYLVMPRGDLEPWCLRRSYLKKKLAMFLYQRRDITLSCCIVATSIMEANNIRNLGFNNPIAIIPNGIDVAEYKCRPLESICKVKKQVLFLSRIHPKKGIEILIEAWGRLLNIFPEWSILIVGNGEESYIQSLKTIIQNKGMEGRIKIIPPIFGEEKIKLYQESSVFILPTYSENFGMVIAEAMSCGLPVITTNGTPWQELNTEHIGWCVDLSTSNIEKTLKTALSLDNNELFNMGQKASKHVHDKYDYLSVALKTKELYLSTLDNSETVNLNII